MRLKTRMILVIDNYDSFTWNLVHYLMELGAEVEVVRNDAIGVGQALSSGADAFLISPGPCTPNEAGISLALVAACAESARPLLGVCLGHQAIGQHFGGKVVRGGLMHGKTSAITHDASAFFEGLPSPFTATRYHSLVVEGAPDGIELFHGYTYSGHPIATAAALATLKLYRDEGIFERAAALMPLWEDAVHSLAGEPHVIDIRNIGIVGAIEMSTRDGMMGARAMDAMNACFWDENLLVRITGEIIALSPPLIVSESQVGEIVDRVRRVLRSIA